MNRAIFGISLWMALGCDAGSTEPDMGVGGSGNASGSGGSSGSSGSGGAQENGCQSGSNLTLLLLEDGVPINYPRGPREFAATIVDPGEHSVVLETCPSDRGGNAEGGAGGEGTGGAGGTSGCEENLRLEIDAPELSLSTSVGTRVDVEWNAFGGGATQIQAVAVLRERGNTTTGGFLLGATTGLPLAPSLVEVTAEQLRCAFEPPSEICGSRVAYALVFSAVENPSSSVRLVMGQSGNIELDPSSEDTWRARNVRAYTSGYCDAPDPHLYYLVKNAP